MAEEFETVELEYSEEDILYYIEDEGGVEIGFALMEDGKEVEYYYEGFDGEDYETVAEPDYSIATESRPAAKTVPAEDDGPEEHGYLYKMAAIAGHQGGKVRSKAEVKLDKARSAAEKQYTKAKGVAAEQAAKTKAEADELDLGITREGVARTTADLNALAKEGAETAKELKGAYDDIMENVGWMLPKGVKRRLP